MNILGIVHPYTHDAAACIMMQQGLCAFAEEERFTRIKYQTGIPLH